MPSIVDKKTGKIRDVDHGQVQSFIESGNYQLAEGALYDVILPGGQIEQFEAADATQLLAGRGRYASPEEGTKIREFADYGDRPFSAAAAGLFDYGTLGLGPAALKALSPELGEDFEKIEGFNSGVYHGTGITASIAAAIMSLGGTSLVQGGAAGVRGAAGLARGSAGARALFQAERAAGKSAVQAMEAVNAARATAPSLASEILLGRIAHGTEGMSTLGKIGTYATQVNPPAILNRVGSVSGNAVAGFISKHGTHAVIPGLGKSFAELAPLSAKLTSGVSGLVADGVVQGGLYGFGEGLSEVALGDIDNAAEHILATMGMNAMLGAAGGAGFGLGIPLIGKSATGAMRATGGLYGYFAKSAVSKAMTNSLARISHAMNKELRQGDLEELMLLYRLDDVGKLARKDMMELAKRIDDVGQDMSKTAQETFLIEEIIQQADKNGVKFGRVRDLVEGSNVPAIKVLMAFKETINKTVSNADDAALGNRNNKEELERFFREWADAETLDNIYGVDRPGWTGQQKRGAAVVRKWSTTEGEDVQRGMARVLSNTKLNGFFDRMVDWLHDGRMQSQEKLVKARGVITDQEREYLDNYNRFINKNIEYYDSADFLTPSERSGLIASLNKARNSGDLTETRKIIERLKETNRVRYTGSNRHYNGRLNPDTEYLDPVEAAKRAKNAPVDPESLKVSAKAQARIDKVEDLLKVKKRNIKSQEESVRKLEDDLHRLQSKNPESIHSINAHQVNIEEHIDELVVAQKSLQKEIDAIKNLEVELKKLKPGRADVPKPHEGPDFKGDREMLEDLRSHLVGKIGPVRSLVEDPTKPGKMIEKLSPYRGSLSPDQEAIGKVTRSPEHRNLLDKKMQNFSDYEMDVSFPEITLTPEEYRTLTIVDRAIKEGHTFLDEVGLAPSKMVPEWEALPKLTQKQLGLRRFSGHGKGKVDIYSLEGNEAIEKAVKEARLKLNTQPEIIPRSEAVETITKLRLKGDIDGIINILNEAKIKGLNSEMLQAVVWDEIQTINNFFHESTMAGILNKGTAEGSVDTLKGFLHRFLEDKSIFGRNMAAYKKNLEDDRFNYGKLQEQFRSMFGLSRGSREFVDPDAITKWMTELKHRSAAGDIGRLKDHAILGEKYLQRLLRDFDIDKMDYKFTGVVKELLKDMGIVKTEQPGVWMMGNRTIGSKQLIQQLQKRMRNAKSDAVRHIDFADKQARSAIRWGAATSNAANVRGLMRPSSFMGYFGSVPLGVAMNVVESIQDPRLGIARLHAIETLAETGRKELDNNLDAYIDYLASGKKATLRVPRAFIGPAVSKRDFEGSAAEADERARYKLTEEQYDEAKDFLVTMASSPSQLSAFTEAATEPLGDSAPQAREAMRKLLKTKILYMHRMLPNAARGNLFDMSPRPSTMQMARFARVIEAVNDPVGAMSFALTEGTLTREVIEAVEETSPSVFADVRMRLIEKLSDQEFSSQIRRQDKMMLAGMFNIPVVNGRLGKRLRENVRPGEKPGPEARPKPMDTSQFNSPMDLISGR